MAQIFSDDDHDTVVKKYAELVQKNNPEQFRVYTILTEGNDIKLGGLTPDIVLSDNEGNKVITVIEVETATSIDLTQAETRWKPIASAVANFQLLVPKGTSGRAKRLCKKIGIKSKIQEY